MIKKVFTWRDDYSVGVEDVDNQHKELIRIINELYTAFLARSEQEHINQTLDSLEEYAGFHFGFEESYYRKHQYSQTIEHIGEHKAFVKRLGEMRKKAEEDTNLTYELINFMRTWLVDHISKTDKVAFKEMLGN